MPLRVLALPARTVADKCRLSFFSLLQTLKVAAANGKKVSSSTSSTRQRVHSKISSAIFFSTIYVGKKRQ